MAVFASKINTSSETFQRQRAEMLELVDKLNELNVRLGMSGGNCC